MKYAQTAVHKFNFLLVLLKCGNGIIMRVKLKLPDKPGWIIAGFTTKRCQHYKVSLTNSHAFAVQPRVHVR